MLPFSDCLSQTLQHTTSLTTGISSFISPSYCDILLSPPPSISCPPAADFLHTSVLPILIFSLYFHPAFPPLLSSELTSLCISVSPPHSALILSLSEREMTEKQRARAAENGNQDAKQTRAKKV